MPAWARLASRGQPAGSTKLPAHVVGVLGLEVLRPEFGMCAITRSATLTRTMTVGHQRKPDTNCQQRHVQVSLEPFGSRLQVLA